MINKLMPFDPRAEGDQSKSLMQPTKQFTLTEQIERANRAAARMDAGYYFDDRELDVPANKAPHRPSEEKDEWL